MNVLVAGGAALVVLTVAVIAGAWRLVMLDRELTRMDDELARLQAELHSTQRHLLANQDQVRDTVILTRQIRHYLEWADPWLRYFVGLSQERGR